MAFSETIAHDLTHDELLEITKSSLCTLISCDSLLSDLPTDIILEEVLSQVRLGSSCQHKDVAKFQACDGSSATSSKMPSMATIGVSWEWCMSSSAVMWAEDASLKYKFMK